jgi:hypothetical protein
VTRPTPVPSGVTPEIMDQAWNLIRHGWALEAERVLAQATGSGTDAKAIVASLVRRKLHLHN